MASDKSQQETGVQPELHPPGNTVRRDVSDTQSYRWLWLSLAAILVLGLLGVITKGKFGYGLESLIPMMAAAAAYFALAGMGLEPETLELTQQD